MSADDSPAAGSATPTRGPSGLDLLRWSDDPPENAPSPAVRISATNDSSAFMNASNESPRENFSSRSAIRTNQPAGGVSTITFGAQTTPEEAEALQRRKCGSESKRREMTGSGIFDHAGKSDLPPAFSSNKPAVRVNKPIGGTSQIAFGTPVVSPQKPSSLPEVAKQRELSGTFESTREAPAVRRPCSSAKSKELEGSNIFGKTSDISPKSLTEEFEALVLQQENRAPRTSVKVSHPAGGKSQIWLGTDHVNTEGMRSKKLVKNQKVAELSGNNIFSEGKLAGAEASEKLVSAAKRREMMGNDIFADGKPIHRDRMRGVRQPPGGESHLKLL